MAKITDIISPTTELGKSRLTFLDDTIEFYGADPLGRRAVGHDNCLYRADNGNKCAIGRHIPDDKYNVNFEYRGISILMHTLPDEVQALGDTFLKDVQLLHDEENYWDFDENGLSAEGIHEYHNIVEQHCK